MHGRVKKGIKKDPPGKTPDGRREKEMSVDRIRCAMQITRAVTG